MKKIICIFLNEQEKQKRNKMKKIFLGLAALAFFLTAFTILADKSSATVDQKEGLYVFILSKPTAQYEYLGSVKKVLAWSGKPEEMLNSLIKKVKKEYPKANGIIFTNVDMDKADAIEFKDK
jgi:ABC-type glycerol-3-phosphate transport system substrate-binding protein